MAGRKGSMHSVAGFAVAVALLVAGDALAQPLGPPRPGSQPGSGELPPPTIPVAPALPTAPAPQPPATGGPGTPGDPTPPPLPGSGLDRFMVSGPGSGLPPRFSFVIDPKTPTKDLLPTPPAAKPAGPITADDIAKIPEVDFRARPGKDDLAKQRELTAHQLAKINHLNAKKTDAFMAALLESRDDLAGLPFVMGDDCRTIAERAKLFTTAVNTVRQALGSNPQVLQIQLGMSGPPNGQPFPQVEPRFSTQAVQPAPTPAAVASFWTQYAALCEQQDGGFKRPDKTLAEHVALARIAALTQMLAAESAELRLGLVKYLNAVAHPEATKTLARMAIFSPEDDVRNAALDVLKVRREKDYTDVLLKGLRYPWPAVAKRAAEACVKLGRTDLVPELVTVLAEADPRLPATKEVGGKKVSVVREMVRINHHRNCILCHAPGSPENVTTGAITAEVAVPGQPLLSPSEGYNRPQSSPDMMIRIDVTYLRQDFSAMMPVADAHPWPESQRFDFLVRERKVTDEEAEAYRERLVSKEAGVLSPYHKAAVAALRELTGKDTTPTAEAWRKLLNISAKTGP